MPRTKTLSAAAADTIRTLRVVDAGAEFTAEITAGQLDPKVYKEVKETLLRIAGGGRWNRGRGLHVFSRDPRPELDALVGGEGDMVMPVDQDQALSFFATPAALAQLLVEGLGYLSPASVLLEPSAGDGAIVRALRAAFPDACIDAIEVDVHRAASIDGASEVFAMPFADFHAVTAPGMYDAVVMNPPFTEPGNATAWLDHITLAWSLVRPGGRLRAVAPASFEQRQTGPIAALRARVEDCGSWRRLPDDAFKTSGTLVRTVLIDLPGVR